MGESKHVDVVNAYKLNHNMFRHHHKQGMIELLQGAQRLRKTDIHTSFCNVYEAQIEQLRLLFEEIEKEF